MKLDKLRERSKLAESKYLAAFHARYAAGSKVRWLHQGGKCQKYIQEGIVQHGGRFHPDLFVKNTKTGKTRWISDHCIIFD